MTNFLVGLTIVSTNDDYNMFKKNAGLRFKVSAPVDLYHPVLTDRKITLGTKKLNMKHNMGNIDRIIRILIAVVIAVLYFTNTITGIFGYVLLAVGGIFLLTSLVGSCPLYSVLGINTCQMKKTSAK